MSEVKYPLAAVIELSDQVHQSRNKKAYISCTHDQIHLAIGCTRVSKGGGKLLGPRKLFDGVQHHYVIAIGKFLRECRGFIKSRYRAAPGLQRLAELSGGCADVDDLRVFLDCINCQSLRT